MIEDLCAPILFILVLGRTSSMSMSMGLKASSLRPSSACPDVDAPCDSDASALMTLLELLNRLSIGFSSCTAARFLPLPLTSLVSDLTQLLSMSRGLTSAISSSWGSKKALARKSRSAETSVRQSGQGRVPLLT